jgi:hypothetical protein
MGGILDGRSGVLDVEFESASYFLRSSLSYTVRDARGIALESRTGQRTLILPAGLYSISAIGSDGRMVERTIEVRAGEHSKVRVGDGTSAADWRLAAVERPRVRGGSSGHLVAADGPEGSEIGRLAACHLRQANVWGWELEPDRPLTEVPTVQCTMVSGVWEISVPLNPQGPYPLDSCWLTPADDSERPRVVFAEERRVARFVAGIDDHAGLQTATDVLREASALLLHKYSDPPAAALAGLTLHRLGQLSSRAGWIENLARDFAWLPDGAILLSALLALDNDPDERRRGLDTLLRATASRPLYTDGLSLAMELLRRWPSDDLRAERHDRLDQLAAWSAYADWSSLALCVELRPGRESA